MTRGVAFQTLQSGLWILMRLTLLSCFLLIASCTFHLGCSSEPPLPEPDPSPPQPVVDGADPDPVDTPEPPAEEESPVPLEDAGDVVLSELMASTKEDFESAKAKYEGKPLRFECWAVAFVTEPVIYGKKPAFFVTSSKPKDKNEIRDLPRITCKSAGALPWETFNAPDPVTVTGVAKFEYGKVSFEQCTFESTGEPAPTLTVAELVAMAEEDADAVAEKYGKGWLNLKGKVQSVRRNDGEDPFIIFHESEVIEIGAQLSSLKSDPLQSVKAGDEITIGGPPFVFSRKPLILQLPIPLKIESK